MIRKRHFDEEEFRRNNAEPLKIDEEIAGGKFFTAIKQAKNVCFIGDSITHGTKKGGVAWYEPIAPYIGGTIYNASFGGATIKLLIQEEFLSKIVAVPADLFVVAIGTNDVRYRKSEICAMTPEEYIDCLQVLWGEILSNNPAAKFIFIAPWTSTDGDRFSALKYHDKIKLNNKYTVALKNWCAATGDIFINANFYIKAVLNRSVYKDYLTDWIHPTATAGVALYSAAVLRS